MSKTKAKNGSELEYLRGLVKQYKSEARQLRRQVKSLQNRSHFYERIEEEENPDGVDMKGQCPSCKEGILFKLDLPHMVLTKCDSCDHTTREKISDKETDTE